MIGIYRNDPTHVKAATSYAKAVLTPNGPGTMRLSWDSSGDITADAWGDGAEWLLDRAPHWGGLNDNITGFDPGLYPRIERLWRAHNMTCLAAAGVIWQELVLVLPAMRSGSTRIVVATRSCSRTSRISRTSRDIDSASSACCPRRGYRCPDVHPARPIQTFAGADCSATGLLVKSGCMMAGR